MHLGCNKMVLSKKAIFLRAGAIAIAGGILIGLTFVYIAFNDNLHGEYIDQDTGAIQIIRTLGLFFSWTMVGATIVLILEGIAWWTFCLARLVWNTLK